ncbi:MAG TPA: TetR/AcrR family transcriptional regulator [Acidobacteriota bacterium]|jgi:AcrR family transcriptional regulator
MRFDQRYQQILHTSAQTFAAKGFAAASIRDLSRATRLSLAGLYYYFDSKEALLFRIQSHCLRTLIARLDRRLEASADPEQQLRLFIANHLRSFAESLPEMKVLARDADALGGRYGRTIAELRASYQRRLIEILERLQQSGRLRPIPLEAAAAGLLGMLNTLYLWYQPVEGAKLGRVAESMAEVFLSGVVRPKKVRLKPVAAADR